jgi:RNA recognition motif-containing protein
MVQGHMAEIVALLRGVQTQTFVSLVHGLKKVCHAMAHHISRFSVMNLYVGNLSYQMTDDELRAAFEPYGEVSSAKIIRDRETGRSKGFGFVEMPVESEGEEAIRQLDNADFGGRNLKVNQARPRTETPRRPRF